MIYPEIEIKQGQDYFLTFSVASAPPPNNNPIDVTGATGKFVMKYNITDNDDVAISMKTIGDGMELEAPLAGEAKIRIYAADTAKITMVNGFRKVICEGLLVHSGGLVSRSPTFIAKVLQSAIKAAS